MNDQGLKERIKARIVLLKKQQEKYIIEVNQQLVGLQVAIAELEAILKNEVVAGAPEPQREEEPK